MKRLLITTLFTAILAGIFAVSAVASPEDFVTEDYQFMWKTDWSSDGTHIAFSSNKDIYTVDISTGEVVKMTDGPEYEGHNCTFPIYSHDGTKLFFSWRDDNPEGETYENGWKVYNTDYIDLVSGERVTFLKGAYALNISRDDRYAVYVKDLECHAVYDFETGEETVYEYPEGEIPVFEYGHCEFSPDNSYFISTCGSQALPPDIEELNDYYKLYKVDRVSGEKEILDIGDLSYWYPRFSPDGSKLVMSQIDYYEKEIPRYPMYRRDEVSGDLIVDTGEGFYMPGLYVINPDTGEYENMCYDNYYAVEGEQDIFCKENGEWVNIASKYPPGQDPYPKTRTKSGMLYEVALYDFESGVITPIHVEGFFQSKMASWSPDGSQVCYVLIEEAGNHKKNYLYIYDLDLGAHKMVINGPTGETTPTAVEADPLPAPFAITGNYPNPFNPTTTIEFTLEKAGDISLDIFNIMGQKICSLESAAMSPGAHSLVWNGRDDSGIAVSSGVYICRLKMGEAVQSKAMLLAK